MKPAFEIARNFPHCDEYSDQSFLGKLHEDYIWDEAEYWAYEAALYGLATIFSGSSELPRELAWRVLRIYSHALLLIGCHSDSRDKFKIRNLSDDQITELRERLQLVNEGFFKGEMPNQAYFAHPNPRLTVESDPSGRPS
jgi:hypothetical protein